MTRAVFLDALGTLVELEPPWLSLRDRVPAEVSDQRLEEALRAEMAYYRDHAHEGRDEDSLADLRERCAAIVSEKLGVEVTADELVEAIRFDAYPDALPALRELRDRGLSLVAVSNWDCSLPAVLERCGLGELLDGAVSSAAAGARKPDPAIFEPALELAGCAPRGGPPRGRHSRGGRRGSAGGRHPSSAHRPERERGRHLLLEADRASISRMSEPNYAGFWRRCLASLLDNLVWVLFYCLVLRLDRRGCLPGRRHGRDRLRCWSSSRSGSTTSPSASGAGGRRSARTPPESRCARWTAPNGSPTAQASIRNLLRIVDFFLIGEVMIAAGKRKQRLGDWRRRRWSSAEPRAPPPLNRLLRHQTGRAHARPRINA